MGGGDQSPFRARGGSAAALEAVDPAVELRVREDRFDHGVAAAVEVAAVAGREHPPHEGVKTSLPDLARAPLRLPASAGSDHSAAAREPLDLVGVPVAGVGQHHRGRVSHSGRSEFDLSGGDHRFELPEVGSGDRHLGRDHNLIFVQTAWAL